MNRTIACNAPGCSISGGFRGVSTSTLQAVLAIANALAPEFEFYNPHECEGSIFLDSDVADHELELDKIEASLTLTQIEEHVEDALRFYAS